jgi:hypothetical protein
MLPWWLFFLNCTVIRDSVTSQKIRNSIMKVHILFNHKKNLNFSHEQENWFQWFSKIPQVLCWFILNTVKLQSVMVNTVTCWTNYIMHQFHHKVAHCFQMAVFNSIIWSNVLQLLKIVRTWYLKVPHYHSHQWLNIHDGVRPSARALTISSRLLPCFTSFSPIL